MAISRRDLIRNGLVALSVGAASPHFLVRAVHATPRTTEALRTKAARSLIVVEMAGGNDSLNTLIPYADQNYYRVRPTLGIKREEALPISDSLALHPSMGKLKELYDRKQLVVVPGIGYPNFNFSHFRAMEIYRSGDTGQYTGIGWLGRYLDQTVTAKDDLFAGLTAAAGVSPAMNGDAYHAPAIASANAYQLATDPRFGGDRTNRLNAFTALNKLDVSKPVMLPLLEDTANAAYASSRELQDLVRAYSSSVQYPANGIGNSMKLMGQVVTSDVGLQVGYVTIGGFDTHAGQPAAHRTLLQQVSDAVSAFLEDMEAHGFGERVAVLMLSEFGRRVEENGSDGTDHGSAQTWFLAGKSLKGGIYGTLPSLTDLDNKNLKMTTDFRSVYATLIQSWLGSDPAKVLQGSYQNLGFVA